MNKAFAKLLEWQGGGKNRVWDILPVGLTVGIHLQDEDRHYSIVLSPLTLATTKMDLLAYEIDNCIAGILA